jgi:peptidoglycan/LPS O-acetylase OafA/YrhL
MRFQWPSLTPATGRFGLMVLRFGIASAISVSIAWLSRCYFEEPFLRVKQRFTS